MIGADTRRGQIGRRIEEQQRRKALFS